MSDNPLLAFAIGSLAASRGSNELAHLSASIMAPRPARAVSPGADTVAMIEALQEQEQHIARQDDLIARLRAINVEWQEYGAKLKAQKVRLQEWADWADMELKKYQNKA